MDSYLKCAGLRCEARLPQRLQERRVPPGRADRMLAARLARVPAAELAAEAAALAGGKLRALPAHDGVAAVRRAFQ